MLERWHRRRDGHAATRLVVKSGADPHPEVLAREALTIGRRGRRFNGARQPAHGGPLSASTGESPARTNSSSSRWVGGIGREEEVPHDLKTATAPSPSARSGTRDPSCPPG